MNRAERRRRARSEQKASRRLNHPRHGADPGVVLMQLINEGNTLGISPLVDLADFVLAGLPEGSVGLARRAFTNDFSTTGENRVALIDDAA